MKYILSSLLIILIIILSLLSILRIKRKESFTSIDSIRMYTNDLLNVEVDEEVDTVEDEEGIGGGEKYTPPLMRKPVYIQLPPKPLPNRFEEIKINKLKSKTPKKKVRFSSDVEIQGTLNSDKLLLNKKAFVNYNKKDNSFDFM